MAGYTFEEFMDIIRKLRSKEGCPWDREQTHGSLKNCLIEECYETIEAINNEDSENLCEELGDVLLQVALHSVIAEEAGEFTIEEVVSAEAEKMIRRHPHVFGDAVVEDSEGVIQSWEEIKQEEKNTSSAIDDLLRVPKALPANIRAEKIQKKAAKAGLDFEGVPQVFDMVKEELEKLSEAVKMGDKGQMDEKFGDVMFLIVNLSRVLQLNAENSLTNATNKFINRFVDVFALAESRGQNLCELPPTSLEELWREVKYR
ncbi:MAG TPA: nucleoside triphosphate pyrophosphohydrolase [Clostridiales bacterium]|nr:nucleoside triphosphate pyrophosphohydrolase [Clostridiales bacterium]